MRILYVLPSLLVGGAESLVCQWAGALQRAGHSVDVCTLYAGGPFARRLERSGACLINLDHDAGIARYRLRRKYDPRLALSLARVVRRGGYQIVHGHLFPPLLYLSLVSYLCPQPAYVYSEHSVRNRRRGSAAWKPLDRFLYSRCRSILPVSEGVRSALCAWLPELDKKVHVIPNTVDVELEPDGAAVEALRMALRIAPGEQVILYAGRLVPEKGADLLLEAAAALARRCACPVRVLVAGDGPLRAELEARSRSLPAPVQAGFLGSRDDIPRLLALADLVVLPSRWEGLPMFLLEAMAAGKAVLAAEVGGIPEAVRHGENGWLVPAGDPAALADAAALLLARRDLRERLGQNARRTFDEKYSPRQAVQPLLKVYAQLAGEPEPQPTR